MSGPAQSYLPYRDTKPQGAADFYFAIEATFRFVRQRLGDAGWRQYLAELGRGYYAPVNERWRKEGLGAVAAYWREFFPAEPGAIVEVAERADRVELDVRRCPAIAHLRAAGRPMLPEFCQHCYFLGEARAAAAGLTMRLCGGNGTCRHTYALREAGLPPQDLAAIGRAGP